MDFHMESLNALIDFQIVPTLPTGSIKKDSITWEAEVHKAGNFEVTVYYSCEEDAVGSVFEVSFGKAKIQGKIAEVHTTEEYGAEEDRVIRQESYVKDFKPLKIGVISLQKEREPSKSRGSKKTAES